MNVVIEKLFELFAIHLSVLSMDRTPSQSKPAGDLMLVEVVFGNVIIRAWPWMLTVSARPLHAMHRHGGTWLRRYTGNVTSGGSLDEACFSISELFKHFTSLFSISYGIQEAKSE